MVFSMLSDTIKIRINYIKNKQKVVKSERNTVSL